MWRRAGRASSGYPRSGGPSGDGSYDGEAGDAGGPTAYAERKWLSEAPYGWIKHALGFRRFSLRGLAKVRCEWDLVCLALNVKRLHVLMAA